MIASLKSLADRMRRFFGSSGGQEAVLNAGLDRRSGANLLRRKRMKVALIAILFGVVSGVVDLPLPAEDALRLARAQLRMRPASQDIVMIAIDDSTLNELGQPLPNRHQDSELLERLVQAGVKRIVFDRAHADPATPASDAEFAQTLAKHRGKVWLSMAPGHQTGFQASEPILPHPSFRSITQQASMVSFFTPIGLSIIIPTEIEFKGTRYRSISAVLADYRGEMARYRPDYAFTLNSIPTYSYIDVLRG
ncbi:MAG: CHASE2 domain-containing protein, partial [Porphyrobacter sp.]|nr:CHASE2 domain-containing protein [Porphyrobacter sp.]